MANPLKKLLRSAIVTGKYVTGVLLDGLGQPIYDAIGNITLESLTIRATIQIKKDKETRLFRALSGGAINPSSEVVVYISKVEIINNLGEKIGVINLKDFDPMKIKGGLRNDNGLIVTPVSNDVYDLKIVKKIFGVTFYGKIEGNIA